MGKLKRFIPIRFEHRCRVPLQGAFTLIELLVVMLLLIILVGLLITAISGAKKKARKIQCLSNSKQWGLAIWLYTGDNHDLFPYEGHFLTALDEGVNINAWYNTLSSYTGGLKLSDLYLSEQPPLPGQKSLFVCPAVAEDPKSPPTRSNPFFMYGFNNRMDPNGSGRFRMSQLRKPSQTVIFTENSQARYPSTSGRHTPARHAGKANLAFGDGHAESVGINDYSRTAEEDTDSRKEWSNNHLVYWYPFSGAPP